MTDIGAKLVQLSCHLSVVLMDVVQCRQQLQEAPEQQPGRLSTVVDTVRKNNMLTQWWKFARQRHSSNGFASSKIEEHGQKSRHESIE